MTGIVPTVGRIVLYSVSAEQAERINRRPDWHHLSGVQVHFGNEATEGSVYPAMVVAVWGNTPTCAVNLKVMLDGTDELWATSVSVGDRPGTFHWMPYQKAIAAGEIVPALHSVPGGTHGQG